MKLDGAEKLNYQSPGDGSYRLNVVEVINIPNTS